jgi:hypothetical protein
MKAKDDVWYDQKIESIRKRKRKLHIIQEPKVRKKMKDDLNREARSAKRSSKNSMKKFIDNEINGLNE